MSVFTPSLTKAGVMNVKDYASARRIGALLFGVILIFAAGRQSACAEETFKLSLKDHKFTPSELTVPANERFLIEVENLDPTPAEFESTDLKVEKFVVGGGKKLFADGAKVPLQLVSATPFATGVLHVVYAPVR